MFFETLFIETVKSRFLWALLDLRWFGREADRRF